jgi:hypothetical protein
MFGIDDLLLGITIAAAGAGISAALAPGVPGVSLDNGAGARAEAETLPSQRRVASAAAQGIPMSVPTGRTKQKKVVQQFISISGSGKPNKPLFARTGKMPGNGFVPYKPEEWQPGGKYYQDGVKPQPFEWTVTTNEPETVEMDFTGYGDADVQAKLADQMASMYLELGAEYGPKFIEETRRQLEIADPQGVAARDKLFELTQQQAKRNPVSPVSELLQRQIGEQVTAGRGLDAGAAQGVDAAVAGANADRGGDMNARLLKDAMTRGAEGDARQAEAIRKGTAWLASGLSPNDVQYRARQQNLANLGSFIQGRTPTSQFGSLSNAQAGATPFQPGAALPQMQNNTPGYRNLQLSGWGAQLERDANSANPWMAGLSTLFQGADMVLAKG